MNLPTTMPARSVTAARVHAICEGRDDRLLVLLRLPPPWALPLAAGRWLQALRAAYEDELELLVFLDVPWTLMSIHDHPHAATAAGALLHRLARLRMPAAAVICSAESVYAHWRSPIHVPARAWMLLETTPVHTSSATANPPSGMLAPWPSSLITAHAARPRTHWWPRRVLVDLVGVQPGFATSAQALADAIVDGDIEVGGLTLDGLLPGCDIAPAFRAALTTTLDRFANAVQTLRIASMTRRAPSLRSRL